MIRGILTWPITWALYWIGHGASVVIDRRISESECFDDEGLLFRAFWRVYQTSMCYSSAIQGRSGIGPWERMD